MSDGVQDVAVASARRRSGITLFQMRMEREGRGDELRARAKAIYAGGCGSYRGSVSLAAAEMGYRGREVEEEELRKLRALLFCDEETQREREHELAILRLQEEGERRKDRERAEATVEDARRRERKKRRKWSEVYAALPQESVNKHDDFLWVKSHPAMMRKEQGGGDDHVTVELEDITKSDNGPPPSKAAVVMLVNYVNRPREFVKEFVTQFKKEPVPGKAVETEQEAEASLAETPVGEEIRRLKDLMRKGKKKK